MMISINSRFICYDWICFPVHEERYVAHLSNKWHVKNLPLPFQTRPVQTHLSLWWWRMHLFKIWLSSWHLTWVPSLAASPAGTLTPCPADGQLIPTVEMGQISTSGTSAMVLVIAKCSSSLEQDILVRALPGKSLCTVLTSVSYLSIIWESINDLMSQLGWSWETVHADDLTLTFLLVQNI